MCIAGDCEESIIAIAHYLCASPARCAGAKGWMNNMGEKIEAGRLSNYKW